jgi:LmbE family N-acetylglucosaminyl deacetylase
MRDGKRPDSNVALPLGLAHEDHLVVSDAALDAVRGLTVRVYLYEDLPSRVLWPDLVPARLQQLRDMAWELYPRGDMGRGDIEIKELAVRAYRSQLWALDWRSTLVPERYWEAVWQA